MPDLPISDVIQMIAQKNAEQSYNNLDSLELYLRSWWSKIYNRPLKDPLLESYTVYELIYEYFDKIERKKAAEQIVEQENDKIEDEKLDETLSWIEEEERKEREAKEKAKAEELEKDEAWMVEQLKKQYGDQFGEDINLNLGE
jgi:ribosomal protein L15E